MTHIGPKETENLLVPLPVLLIEHHSLRKPITTNADLVFAPAFLALILVPAQFIILLHVFEAIVAAVGWHLLIMHHGFDQLVGVGRQV